MSAEGVVDPAPARPISADLELRLKTYEALLRKWQPKMNLVAPSTLQSIRTRHIEDSLQVSDASAVKNGRCIVANRYMPHSSSQDVQS